MKGKISHRIMLILLVISFINLTFNRKTIQAEETIYIRPDGSVDPSTAPISRVGDVYTFTANIYESIVVERSDIIIDGNGYTLQGLPPNYGFTLVNRNNVTIRKVLIIGFRYGIFLKFSTNNIMERNTILNCDRGGIWLQGSTRNAIAQNVLSDNYCGILLTWSNNTNTILDNTVKNNPFGVMLIGSNNNIVIENIIVNNTLGGIYLDQSNNNKIYHNIIIDNTPQTDISESICIWDNGYPSGGNYWSNYNGVDQKSGLNQDQPGSDGIGDTPHILDDNNMDRYPLISLIPIRDVAVANVMTTKSVVSQNYSMHIYVKLENQGRRTETINIGVYANTTLIETKNVALTSGNSTTITLTWATTGFNIGKYTISVYVWPVQGEDDTLDNVFIDGVVYVGIPADVNGDDIVDIYDCVIVGIAFGSKPEHSNWNSNCDINNDFQVDVYDVVIVGLNFGKSLMSS